MPAQQEHECTSNIRNRSLTIDATVCAVRSASLLGRPVNLNVSDVKGIHVESDKATDLH